MVYVPGERGKKPNPRIITLQEHHDYIEKGKTIALVAKLRGMHESQLREHITENYPSVLQAYKANQTAKYKTTQAKLLKASKPVVIKEAKGEATIHNGLKLALNYKNSIKLWRNCICCCECQMIIAHVPSKEVYDTLDNLLHCPLCGTTTTVEDVHLDPYRKLILLKKNHMSTAEIMEKEDTFNAN